MVDVVAMLNRYFEGDALSVMTIHGRVVAELALAVSHELSLSVEECNFIWEASILHDIGVCKVAAPEIGAMGPHPYIMHGVLGRGILECEGLPRHALVCERHIGVGLTATDIVDQQLPLPCRDMVPLTITEEIICFADLFFSKKQGRLEQRKSPERIRKNLSCFGQDKLQTFDTWMGRFGAALRLG
ncbi:phosphohydrolase [Geobacter sp. AOG2]|uniref:phosphohydrolase n=1 Tax=Geobacter sp. AOG2 TaxID=1566347 RepID=UPI001CC596F5|nr:phosphohydrolase [Geobacter sp. AOG2]GFE60755.1 HD family phosphohydrolase [Geobacter sp. AOG2]